MSIKGIRRALGLSEAAATAAGLLESERLVAAPAAPAAQGKAVKARGPGGGSTRDGPAMAEVLEAVARGSGIDTKTLVAPGQQRPAVRARQLVMYLIRELCPRTSLPAIGYLLNRDHTTVLYGCRRAAALLHRDRAFRTAYLRTRRALTQGIPEAGSRG